MNACMHEENMYCRHMVNILIANIRSMLQHDVRHIFCSSVFIFLVDIAHVSHIFNICSTTFITCPADPKKTLGIKLPFLVMIIKNLKKYFTFEVQVCSQVHIWGSVS